MRHVLPRSVAVLTVTALVACAPAADDRHVDVLGLEQDIHAGLAMAYEPDGLTLFEVACADHDWGPGDVFACTADVERQFVRVRVEVGEARGDVDWTTLDVVHRLDATEELVASQMSEALGDRIRLDCGSPRLRVLPVGSSFRCDAVDSAGNLVTALLTVNGAGQTGWDVLG